MRAKLWWRIGEHFKARAVAEDFQTLEDGRLVVTGTYRGSARRSGGANSRPPSSTSCRSTATVASCH